MNEFRYSPQKYRVHVSEPERAVRIEKIQQLFTADDSHQGGRGLTVDITRVPGMDEEAEGLAPAFDYTGKGCDKLALDSCTPGAVHQAGLVHELYHSVTGKPCAFKVEVVEVGK